MGSQIAAFCLSGLVPSRKQGGNGAIARVSRWHGERAR